MLHGGVGGGGVDEVSRKNGSFAKHLMVCSLPWAPLQETLTFTGNKINQFPKKPIYSISWPQTVEEKLLPYKFRETILTPRK